MADRAAGADRGPAGLRRDRPRDRQGLRRAVPLRGRRPQPAGAAHRRPTARRPCWSRWSGPALRSSNHSRRKEAIENLEALASTCSNLTHLLLVRDLRKLTGRVSSAGSELPHVTRRRRLEAPPGKIWPVVSDPYHLPRWWPRTQRVENVSEGGREPRAASGPRCWRPATAARSGPTTAASARPPRKRYAFEQLLEGTPFEGFLRQRPHRDPPGARGRRHRGDAGEPSSGCAGLSRLGGFMMRRATGRTLAEALAGSSLDGERRAVAD